MCKSIVVCALLGALMAPALAQAKPHDDATKNASKQCKAERSAMGAENFAVKYGTNKNRKNAHGKCVSRTARENENEADAAEKNASKACKAEEAADPAAFALKYGTNKNGKNAHGKCVSQKVKDAEAQADAADAAELNAARACRAEQEADPAAFSAKYGKNKNDKNAFGKCVSQAARS